MEEMPGRLENVTSKVGRLSNNRCLVLCPTTTDQDTIRGEELSGGDEHHILQEMVTTKHTRIVRYIGGENAGTNLISGLMLTAHVTEAYFCEAGGFLADNSIGRISVGWDERSSILVGRKNVER